MIISVYFHRKLWIPNEYRYYSIYQMEVFDTIIILKEMGMPLNEIKKFMDHRSLKADGTF